MLGLDDIMILDQMEQINKKLDKMLNLMQGKPIDYKEPKIKKNKDKKKKE